MVDMQPQSRDGGDREVMKTKISEGKAQTCKEATLTIEVERRNHITRGPSSCYTWSRGFLWEGEGLQYLSKELIVPLSCRA